MFLCSFHSSSRGRPSFSLTHLMTTDQSSATEKTLNRSAVHWYQASGPSTTQQSNKQRVIDNHAALRACAQGAHGQYMNQLCVCLRAQRHRRSTGNNSRQGSRSKTTTSACSKTQIAQKAAAFNSSKSLATAQPVARQRHAAGAAPCASAATQSPAGRST